MEAETVKEDTQNEGAASASNQGVAAAAAPPAKPQEQRREDKRQRRDDRNRREDRNYELFMKAVNAAPPNQQLQIATQKYVSMVEENKKMQFYIKQSDKRHAIILKEKEQLQLEFNKTVLLKSKLENLCRELQKQNKSIKDESLHKIREEEERRKETQAKFQSTLAEISALLQQNNEKNARLRDDNISMTEKFKTVVQQYQMREDQVDKMSKQMELESQLNAAKMQKASLEHQAERERLQVEMETLKMAVVEYRSKVNEMQGTETGLRGQLAVYTDKYDEFQSALMKSNQVFGGFKDQMEKMSKKIKTLEKESLSWKQRWESSQSALLEMCSERQSADSRLAAVQRQLAHMQSLCRTLQSERTLLVSTLKEHDIERPALPAAEPLPLPPPPAPHAAASDAKVDAMAVNCAQLRQSLAHLQSQLNVLTTQQTEEPAQVEKPKKNKNKKKSKKAAVDDKVTTGVVVDDKTKVTTIVADEKPVTEPKNEESTNESTNPKTPSMETTTEVDLEVEKADEKVLESLMEAINIADVKLCDLDAGDNNMTIEEVLEAKVEKITAEPVVTETKSTEENGVIEANELESPKKENQVGPDESNDLPSPKKENQDGPVTPKTAESPKSSPKKIASPKDSPIKIASPKDSPQKIASPKDSPQKVASPKDSPKNIASHKDSQNVVSKNSPKVTEVKIEEDQSAIVKSVVNSEVDSNSLIDKEIEGIQLNL